MKMPNFIIIQKKNIIMSIRWYEQHFQRVVKENQQLKHLVKKQQAQQRILQAVRKLFADLFPQVPVLPIERYASDKLSQFLEYYRTTVGLWLKMLNDKLICYEKGKDKVEQHNQANQLQSEAGRYVKKGQICLVCSHPKDKAIYNNLREKIEQLQDVNRELTDELLLLQQQEQKYLKSITKKLEFQLAELIFNRKKQDKLHQLQTNQLLQQIAHLKQQSDLNKLYLKLNNTKDLQTNNSKEHQMNTNKHLRHNIIKHLEMNNNNKDVLFDQQREILNSWCQKSSSLAQEEQSQIWIVQTRRQSDKPAELPSEQPSELPSSGKTTNRF